LIEEGQASHFFKAEIDVTLMMHTIIGTLMSVCNNIDFLKTIYQAEQLTTEEFITMLRHRLKKHLFIMLRSFLMPAATNNEQAI
jgi:hypothetical protein